MFNTQVSVADPAMLDRGGHNLSPLTKFWVDFLYLSLKLMVHKLTLPYFFFILKCQKQIQQCLTEGVTIFSEPVRTNVCHSPTVRVRVDCVDKNFYLGHNFQTIKDIAFIFFIFVFLMTTPFTWYHIFDLVTLTLKFDLLLKNLNPGHNFQTRSDGAFNIAHVYSL